MSDLEVDKEEQKRRIIEIAEKIKRSNPEDYVWVYDRKDKTLTLYEKKDLHKTPELQDKSKFIIFDIATSPKMVKDFKIFLNIRASQIKKYGLEEIEKEE